MRKLTGKSLNAKWKVGAMHALYREDGKWYHHLKQFPGALFDFNGYIVFATEQEYEACEHLAHGVELHVNGSGISSIPGYVRMGPAQ
ncbi:MAG: hypothetical protein F4027_09820 [Rhodospirillaceae bacterium]|nr:hypothetical protein [Rhodospirillaceae bacterium]MYH39259.1 hypothetical protein [Rhodospirillaceae bacterium]MYK14219.1 hypothetical protein [Rhodospirillaceae bacterium]MYK58870.1 hypothetical protein [Rhodospirillaceae bacterium]